jgi:formate hydrogenlyase subunit 3/multisubunit Na+/H+ antiporter MnhD subunit
MLYAAALQAGQMAPSMIAWAASLGTVFLGVKATSAVFLGPVVESTKDAHESPPTMLWGMGLLAAGSIVLGIAPQLAVNLLLNPVLRAFALGSGVHVTWLGLSSDAGSFSSMGGLVLAVVSLLVGGLIYVVAYVAKPVTAGGGPAMAGAGGGIFTGGEPLPDQDRLTASDFSSIFQQNWKSFFRWTNVDRVYLAVWETLESASREVAAAVKWFEARATAMIVVLAAAVFVTVRWLLPGSQVAQGASAEVAPIPLLLIGACAVAALAVALVALAGPQRNRVPIMLVAGASAVTGLLMPQPWPRLGLLEFAALLTVVLVWQTARSAGARYAYLAVVLISATSSAGAELLAGTGHQPWARALLLTGVCVKLASVPMFFWLLRLADEVPAVVLGVIIAVVDMAAFGEFVLASHANPGVLTPPGLLLGGAALTSLLASLLMLSERNLKRLLVLSTAEDVGFLLMGLAVLSPLGTEGALIAAATHALAKALLFACLAAPEAAGELDREPKALAVRYPVSAFGFLFGMLAMLGVPPLMGFLGRWRLYESAAKISLPLLAVFILSSIFALIAYTLALTRSWWGPPDSDSPPGAREPWLVRGAIVVLCALLLAAGAWPSLLAPLMGGRL